MVRLSALLIFAFAGLAGQAVADPCTRIPDRGPLPPEARRNATFSGPVVYVGDGDSLCVETVRGIEGAGWLEVRVADFRAPELHEPGGTAARNALVQIVLARRIDCIARNRTFDRVAAVCRLNGVRLDTLLRQAGVREGGN